MGLVWSQHCPCFSCLLLTALTGRHCHPRVTCKAQTVQVPCSGLPSKCRGQDPDAELTTSTPGCTAAPCPPPHGWLSIRCAILRSQSKAAALTPPLLNQPPRESKLGDSDEYYWLTYLVFRKALSSVSWGRPTGKSYTHNIIVCVCMEV